VSIGEFFEEYLDVMDAEGVLDYAELVHRSRILLTDPDVVATLRREIGCVFVDEYQDTDPAQVRLLQTIAGAGADVVVSVTPTSPSTPSAARRPAASSTSPTSSAPATAPRRRCWPCSRPAVSGLACSPPAAASPHDWRSRALSRPRCTRPSGTPGPTRRDPAGGSRC
jgi:hypothetical protein